jgi:hypothetical protein
VHGILDGKNDRINCDIRINDVILKRAGGMVMNMQHEALLAAYPHVQPPAGV